ncbi:GNAT family N-acetyltransferase [Paenibacillus sp. S-38]|uniref:GNAT family N-acetyltransferase n=1 Tax=Paenibacillus sp. S-38 TaxID=3416710 RepID=UPI003CF5A49B
MIVRLDLTDPTTARSLLQVQTPSYLVEAELIGFHGIPALKDTVESLAQSGETFYGSFTGSELAGAAAYELDGDTMEITRLVVHPKFFRRGIGGSLIRFLLGLDLGVKGYRVSTGAKNGPAKQLYTNYGFTEAGELEVAPQVFLTLLERGAGR